MTGSAKEVQEILNGLGFESNEEEAAKLFKEIQLFHSASIEELSEDELAAISGGRDYAKDGAVPHRLSRAAAAGVWTAAVRSFITTMTTDRFVSTAKRTALLCTDLNARRKTCSHTSTGAASVERNILILISFLTEPGIIFHLAEGLLKDKKQRMRDPLFLWWTLQGLE